MKSLAKHGIAWRFRGIPRFDDPGDPQHITGYLEVEKWREEDLRPDQRAELEAMIAEAGELRPDISEPRLRWLITEQEGIEHTHRWGPIPRSRVGQACSVCDVWLIGRASG